MSRLCLIGWLLILSEGLGFPSWGGEPAFDDATFAATRFQLMPGLQLDVWAAEPQLMNGVAFSFDNQGRCYIAETHRYGRSVFDITQNTNWLVHDLSFRTVQDRTEFLVKTFGTNGAVLTRDSELVRLVEDRTGKGRADHSEVFADGFRSVADGTAAGVLAQGTNVWFGNIPALWRIDSTPPNLRLSDSPAGLKGGLPVGGSSRPRQSIASGFGVHIGVTGHDLHGLIMGPDGRVYMSFGDRGLSLTNLEGRRIDLPDTGGVLRCDPDGRNLEVFCFGLRNPQELAFDDLGNLWTVDNDTAGPDPCRVLHLVEGGDYGWRCSYQHMDAFGPWVQEEIWRGSHDGVLPLAGTVSQGPSGLVWYPGTGFGDRFKGKFLHCDFPAGIWAFSVKPMGATYVLDKREHFLWNIWATDVDFGPDGAAYVLDWVSGWQMPQKGRIYRITDPIQAGSREVLETKRLLGEGMQARSIADLLQLLEHKNQRVRLEAQWELASRQDQAALGLLQSCTASRKVFARIHALWGMSQMLHRLPPGHRLPIDLSSLKALLTDPEPEVRAQAARVVVWAGIPDVRDALIRLVVDDSPRVRLYALLALADVPSETWDDGTLHKILQTLFSRGEPDPYVAHGAVRLLEVAGGLHRLGNPAWYFDDPSVSVRKLALLDLRRRRDPGISRFLDDASPGLVEEAARAIHDAPIVEGFPKLARLLSRVDCPTGILSRVIDAGYRIGSQQHAQMIAGLALRRDVPDDARRFALNALASWGHPSPIDLVNGLWHPLIVGHELVGLDGSDDLKSAGKPVRAPHPSNPFPPRFQQAGSLRLPERDLGRSSDYDEGSAVHRNDQAARRAFLRVADEILDPSVPDQNGVAIGGRPSPAAVQLAVVEAAQKLGTKEASHPLFERFKAPGTPPEVRMAIVAALAQLNAAETGEVIRAALVSNDPTLKSAALPYLDKLQGDDSVEILRSLVSERALGKGGASIRLTQGAILALASHTEARVETIFQELADALRQNKLPMELRLEVVEAIRRHSSLVGTSVPPSLQLTNSSANQQFGKEYLMGGDRDRGRRIFAENQVVQCIRCHQVAGNGGVVGPKLDGIGRRVNREYLLESIVSPNARLAPGFENAVLVLEDRRTVTGIVKAENSSSIDLEVTEEDGSASVRAVPKRSITRRSVGPSAMPEGFAGLLTPFELRDLVEYLASLQ